MPTVTNVNDGIYGDSAYVTFTVDENWDTYHHAFSYRLFKNSLPITSNQYAVGGQVKFGQLDTNTLYTLKAVNTCAVEVTLATFTTEQSIWVSHPDSFPPPPVDTCYMPGAVHTAVAFYDDSTAYAYIDLEYPDGDSTFTYKLYEDTIQVGGTYYDSNSYMVFPALPFGHKYTVKAVNTCAVEADMAIINTTVAWDSLVVFASQKMMEYITELTSDTANLDTTLYGFIKNLPDIHVIEKSAALQGWHTYDFLPAAKVYNLPTASEFKFDSTTFTLDAVCDCHFVVHETPYYSKHGTTTIVDDIAGVRETGNNASFAWNNDFGDHGWAGNGDHWVGYGYFGPAKYQQSRTQARSSTEYSTEYGDIDGTGSTSYAKFVVSYICTNANGTVNNDCGCDREVVADYRYDTKLVSWAVTPNCGLCTGAKKSYVTVEDMAVVTVGDGQTKNLTILDAGSAKVQSSATYSLNPAFLTSLTDVAAQIAKISINWKTTDPIQTVDSIARVLDSIWHLPASTLGSSSDQSRSGNLVQGNATITIPANKTKVISLFSASSMAQKGETSWGNNGTIYSDFSLALRFTPGQDPVNPICCNPVVGAWSSGSVGGAPISQTSLEEEIDAFLSALSGWGIQGIDVSTMWGAQVGLTGGVCDVQLGGMVIPNNQGNATAKAVVGDNGIFITFVNAPSEKAACKYNLYDINGKLIKSGTVSQLEKIYEFPNDNAAGFYFINLEYMGTVNRQKIAVIK